VVQPPAVSTSAATDCSLVRGRVELIALRVGRRRPVVLAVALAVVSFVACVVTPDHALTAVGGTLTTIALAWAWAEGRERRPGSPQAGGTSPGAKVERADRGAPRPASELSGAIASAGACRQRRGSSVVPPKTPVCLPSRPLEQTPAPNFELDSVLVVVRCTLPIRALGPWSGSGTDWLVPQAEQADGVRHSTGRLKEVQSTYRDPATLSRRASTVGRESHARWRCPGDVWRTAAEPTDGRGARGQVLRLCSGVAVAARVEVFPTAARSWS